MMPKSQLRELKFLCISGSAGQATPFIADTLGNGPRISVKRDPGNEVGQTSVNLIFAGDLAAARPVLSGCP